jgi:hypothetical protein
MGYNYCKSNIKCYDLINKYDCDRAGCTWSGYVAPEEYCYGTASQLSSQLYCPSSTTNCGNICFALGDQCVIECSIFTNYYTCKSYDGCRWNGNVPSSLTLSPIQVPVPNPLPTQVPNPAPNQYYPMNSPKPNSGDIIKPFYHAYYGILFLMIYLFY